MTLDKFLQCARELEKIAFTETMNIIDQYYHYTPVSFSNGKGDTQLINTAGTNEGSCKVFAFAQLNDLTPEQTLNLFGDYYHTEVLEDMSGTGHQNIRQFMQYGWAGINFDNGIALSLK